MRLRIFVTADHIADGERGVCNACPVALAIKDMLWLAGYVRSVLVGSSIIIGNIFRLETPTAVTNFINRYDENERVEPFDFVLDVPLRSVA